MGLTERALRELLRILESGVVPSDESAVSDLFFAVQESLDSRSVITQLRAEVERLRRSNDTLKQACDRHHEAYKVAERERVALVKRSHNQRVEIGLLIEQLTAATARAAVLDAMSKEKEGNG